MSIYGWMASLGVWALLLIGVLTMLYTLIYAWRTDRPMFFALVALLVIGIISVIGVVGLYAEAGR